MHPRLAFEFAQVTESAALAGYHWLGRGQKNSADGAAVEAMRNALNKMDMAGRIVIGEGEIDEAPMLYIGETVGQNAQGATVDIAVDPIEGTRMTAMGQGNAVAVLAASEAGSFLSAPDMYMEKLVTGPSARGAIDLNKSLEENIQAVAKTLNKSVSEITVITLAKPRHEATIEQLHQLGCRVFAIADGDVAASILTCMPESLVDIMYCIGGAPEGIISAAAISALGGDMQARLLLRNQAKGASKDNNAMAEVEKKRCHEMGVTPNKVLGLEDMVKSSKVIFAATGITKGDLVDGISNNNGILTTETLLICSQSRTFRKIQTEHFL